MLQQFITQLQEPDDRLFERLWWAVFLVVMVCVELFDRLPGWQPVLGVISVAATLGIVAARFWRDRPKH